MPPPPPHPQSSHPHPPLTLLPIGYASVPLQSRHGAHTDRKSFNTLYLPYLLMMPFSLFYCFPNPHNSFLQWNYGFKSGCVDPVGSFLLFFLWRPRQKQTAKKMSSSSLGEGVDRGGGALLFLSLWSVDVWGKIGQAQFETFWMAHLWLEAWIETWQFNYLTSKLTSASITWWDSPLYCASRLLV